MNLKQYLKNLLIVKKNIYIFLKALENDEREEYFYWKTKDYLEIIENEIFYIKKIINENEKSYFNSLYSIYDFGAF